MGLSKQRVKKIPRVYFSRDVADSKHKYLEGAAVNAIDSGSCSLRMSDHAFSKYRSVNNSIMERYEADAAGVTNMASSRPEVRIHSPKPTKRKQIALKDKLKLTITRESHSVMAKHHQTAKNHSFGKYAKTNGDNSRDGSRLQTYNDVIAKGKEQAINLMESSVNIVENRSQDGSSKAKEPQEQIDMNKLITEL